jgi:hypothetical protein
MRKTMNINIPITIAQRMDDRGELNPSSLMDFLENYLSCDCTDVEIDELTLTYTFKVDEDIHKAVKMKALLSDMTIKSYVGKLLKKFY